MMRVGVEMLKSMTGFGREMYIGESFQCEVEIKAVNHRYTDIMIRLPKKLNLLEDKIRNLILQSIKRGRIEVSIVLSEYNIQNEIKVDKELAISYHKALKELSKVIHTDFDPNIYELAKFPDVLVREEKELDIEQLEPQILNAVEKATASLCEMRILEGRNILADLNRRIDLLKSQTNEIEEYADEVTKTYTQKLLLRIQEASEDKGIGLDQNRVLQEVALFADHSNITEEIVRLGSHFEQFFISINSNSDTIGRKLDFIIQEINREINTIASKANSFSIANLAVNMKSEVEKIREQIQNIE